MQSLQFAVQVRDSLEDFLGSVGCAAGFDAGRLNSASSAERNAFRDSSRGGGRGMRMSSFRFKLTVSARPGSGRVRPSVQRRLSIREQARVESGGEAGGLVARGGLHFARDGTGQDGRPLGGRRGLEGV